MITTMKNKFLTSFLTLVVAGACTYDFPETVEPTFGSVDMTKIVSVGNSLTAGFMDNALYAAGQTNSFPAILAKQASELNFSSLFCLFLYSHYPHIIFIPEIGVVWRSAIFAACHVNFPFENGCGNASPWQPRRCLGLPVFTV